MKEVRAKKSLGQHFLIDENIAYKITDSITEDTHIPVIEVGPGMGVLTKYLLQKGYSVHAIELDEESVNYLMFHLKNERLNVVQADFLKLDLDHFLPDATEFALIGNYPYNISSQIFFKLLDYRDRIRTAGGMLQKEVAERLAAPPGNKSYGILSVFLRAWFDIEYMFTVPPEVFSPPPKVQSGVIRLVRNGRTLLGCDEEQFKRLVKTAFNQRRKTLRNSLKPLFGLEFDQYDDPIFSLRPEQLDVEDFVRLTTMKEEQIKHSLNKS